MKVIKGDDFQNTLIGEMINIEMGVFHFVNGKARDLHENPKDYHGYPRIEHNGMIDTVKSNMCYIFVPEDMDIDYFAMRLGKLFHNLPEEWNLEPSNQRIDCYRNSYTCIVKTTNKRTRYIGTDADFVYKEFYSSTHNLICWRVASISEILGEINEKNMADSVGKHVASIFWDRDDICELQHNEVTFTFNKSMLRGYKNCVETRVTIMTNGPPLAYELSKFWSCEKHVAGKFKYTPNNVVTCDYSKIHFKPVYDEEGKLLKILSCARCRSPLFGSNYALYGHLSDAQNKLCLPVCPFCLHSTRELVDKYQGFIRFDVKNYDHIKMLCKSTETQNILRALEKSCKFTTISVGASIVAVVNINDEYIGVTELIKYLFTGMSHDPIFAGKKVCAVNVY